MLQGTDIWMIRKCYFEVEVHPQPVLVAHEWVLYNILLCVSVQPPNEALR